MLMMQLAKMTVYIVTPLSLFVMLSCWQEPLRVFRTFKNPRWRTAPFWK